ncbi:MAG: glycoside hydrolase family 65 protein [Thermoleophilia bacterium]|nr:glycoside hydrolase family 65 protein [Thermoleophilia bacterium]
MSVTETLFTVGNGYLGMRGNPEEGRPAHENGTFVNGFHETWPIRHAEEAYGFARTGQTIVNAPDAKVMKLYVDDEPLTLAVADFEEYERRLDFRTGVLTRDILWATPSGKRVRVRSTRMVSFTERHLAVMTIEVTVLDRRAPVVISSQIINRQDGINEYNVHSKAGPHEGASDPRRATRFDERVLNPVDHWHNERRMLMGYRCNNSGMTIAVGAEHAIATNNTYDEIEAVDDDLGKKVYRVHALPGVPIRITKAVAYHTSRGVPVRELFDRCRRTLDRFREKGVNELHAEQRGWLARYWRNTDVVIDDRPGAQQAIRWALFQLAQAAARADQMGIAAKGVSGSGYEGHYFWDTEVYVVPFLVFTNPTMARNALTSRLNLLEPARERARELSQRGALFPWRTINGEEASAYYAAGTAQYHIDADIVYALCKYADVTGDTAFLYRRAMDTLVETARMYADLGFWRPSDEGRSFHIHGVTGPDEYTTVVNNNMFTNVMARFNLERAAALMRRMRTDEPDGYARLVDRLDVTDDEIDEWAECAAAMYIPYDETLEIHPQDDHFLDRELWDLEATPDDNRPLLLHYHPLVIYRFQVLKQADVVLALLLQGDRFTAAEKRADFEYYDPITTGDSTLSAVVQSIIAAEVGYHEMALRYFYDGLFVDLANLHGNTRDGVHVAAAGGVWNCLVYGFAGMRDHDGHITFDPRLPERWTGLTFPLQVCGNRIRVRLTPDGIAFTGEEGGPVHVSVRGRRVTVEEGETTAVPLIGQGPRRPDLEGVHPVVGGHRADGSIITAGVPTPTEDVERLPPA